MAGLERFLAWTVFRVWKAPQEVLDGFQYLMEFFGLGVLAARLVRPVVDVWAGRLMLPLMPLWRRLLPPSDEND